MTTQPELIGVTKKLTAKQQLAAFGAWLTRCKAKFVLLNKPNRDAAEAYFRGLPHHGLMPNERLSDLPEWSLFPSADAGQSEQQQRAAVRADYDRHMHGIKNTV